MKKKKTKFNQQMCKISNHAYPFHDSNVIVIAIDLGVHLTIFYFSCSIENWPEYNLESSNICYNNFHNHGKRINPSTSQHSANLLKLLLWAKLAGVTTLLLSAVGCFRWKSCVTLTADGLFAVELLCQKSKGRIIYTSTKTEYKVKSGLLLDIVVRKGTSILKLLSSKDKTLLIWRNSFLILDLSLYIIDGVRWLNIESDGLSGKGLYEDLHLGVYILD